MTDLLPGDRMIFSPARPGHYPWLGDIVTVEYCLDVRAADDDRDKLYQIVTTDKCHPLAFGSELIPEPPPGDTPPRRDSPPDDDLSARRRREGLIDLILIESV